MRAMPPKTCVSGERSCGDSRRDASVVVEEEDEEAEQADLRRDVEGTGGADPPDAGITQRTSEHGVIVSRLAA